MSAQNGLFLKCVNSEKNPLSLNVALLNTHVQIKRHTYVDCIIIALCFSYDCSTSILSYIKTHLHL